MFKMRLILALLVVFAAQSAGAEEPFAELSFKKACKEAKKHKKVILIDFYATWCGPCKMLDKTTWKDDEVRAFLKAKTIPLKIDAEKERDLAAEYNIRSYPTIILLKADGTEINRLVGYRPPEDFLRDVKKVLAGEGGDSHRREKLEGQDSDDPMKRIKYARALEDDEAYKESLKAYLWCFDHGVEKKPAFADTRLSLLLADIERLGGSYPAALEALKKRRDAAERIVLGKEKNSKGRSKSMGGAGLSRELSSAMELAAINRTLGENEKTLAVFRTLRERDQITGRLADVFLREVIDLLLENREYSEIVTSAGDAAVKVQENIARHKESQSMLARKKKYNDGEQDADLKKKTIDESAKYYEALLGAKKPKSAVKVSKLVTEFDKTDATFASLIRHAIRAKDYQAARALVDEAKKSIDKNELNLVREAARKIPRKK